MNVNFFAGFHTALRALHTAQYGAAVNTQNVANANDPGYTRQILIPSSEMRNNGPGVRRLRDRFIDDQYRRAATTMGHAGVREDVMHRVEDIIGDPVDGGLRVALDQFFDAWHGLADDASDGVARLQVLSEGERLAREIRGTYRSLESLASKVDDELVARVDEVNGYLDQIAKLNVRISELKRNQLSDAALRDQRDVALDRLAELVGATSIEDESGQVRVIVGSFPVVDSPSIVHLKLQKTDTGLQALWGGTPPPSTAVIQGTVGGLLSVRDGELKQVMQDISELGKTLANQVNLLHRSGTGLDGSTGLDFFLVGEGAADIRVNPDLKPVQVAAAGENPAMPSDGDKAREIGHLADLPFLESSLRPGQMQSPRVFYRNLVGWIGARTQEAAQLEDIAKAHLEVSEQQRQSAWGVSLDEEAAYMEIQHKAFAAAARMLSVMDQMLDQLISQVGR